MACLRSSYFLTGKEAACDRLHQLAGLPTISDHENFRKSPLKTISHLFVGRDVDRHHGVGLDEMLGAFLTDQNLPISS